MKLKNFISSRASGAAGIAALFALQSVYEVFFCGGGIVGFWDATFILIAPAALLLVISGSWAALAASVVIVPFIIWANSVECAPYQGGGAAMAYVPAFLFGLPLSLTVGSVVAAVLF